MRKGDAKVKTKGTTECPLRAGGHLLGLLAAPMMRDEGD